MEAKESLKNYEQLNKKSEFKIVALAQQLAGCSPMCSSGESSLYASLSNMFPKYTFNKPDIKTLNPESTTPHPAEL